MIDIVNIRQSNEVKMAEKPALPFKDLCFLILKHYNHNTNCKLGYVVYDYLCQRSGMKIADIQLKENRLLCFGNEREAKNQTMDWIMATGFITREQILEILN